MHLDRACTETKTDKLKSTSEVTLQDSNLEVYWQKGKRPGLVHSRHTHRTPRGWEPALRPGRAGGRSLQEAITHPCQGLLHLIFVYFQVCISWSKQIPYYPLIKISDKPHFVNSRRCLHFPHFELTGFLPLCGLPAWSWAAILDLPDSGGSFSKPLPVGFSEP